MPDYQRLTFYLEQLDPELEEELRETHVRYVERTGRPGYHFGANSGERIFLDLERAVERARALHEEGHQVRLLVRFARRESGG